MVDGMAGLPFTPRVRTILQLAEQEASRLGHNYVGVEHLLLAISAEENSLARHVLRELQVDGAIRARLPQVMETEPYRRAAG